MLAALLAQEIALPGCAPRVFNSIVTDNSTVIASVSEAIQGNKEELDCFVASAPRNDKVHGHRNPGGLAPVSCQDAR